MTARPAQQEEDGVACELPASLEGVERFIALVHEYLAEQGLCGLAFDVELLAREGIMNAVQHGSESDPARTVWVRLCRSADALTLRIQDQGPGFDWRTAALRPPDPLQEKGRGLFIISKYSDSFFFNDQGNVLTMIKRLSMENQGMSNTAFDLVQMALGPNVTAKEVAGLRESFRASIQQGARRIVLDFSSVEHLDSMGIGLLVATHNSLVKLGGALALTGVNTDIHQLLTLMRLDKHFSISTEREAAT
ncbi:anti-anti-sigma factor [Humidesulfovibrio mexicanus]|uniref:Anti-anti-sigma factor n=1 Tax=Humidesulfovibrio mexicanus TaxID=147047 RepID=A0A238XLT7_9BACT|nr:ATP-binding protein [Humidesulfovibrio mexicanus]SNR59945.1 anti-anti-sigma factor [Humidesulfovibrio mexicanus]